VTQSPVSAIARAIHAYRGSSGPSKPTAPSPEKRQMNTTQAAMIAALISLWRCFAGELKPVESNIAPPI
jgi:hypothetical protein